MSITFLFEYKFNEKVVFNIKNTINDVQISGADLKLKIGKIFALLYFIVLKNV